jgi:hypothetical protein
LAILIQGLGTAFVGQRDFWPDGSYITTEWFVFCLVPVIPLRSLRIRKKARKFSDPPETAIRYPFFSLQQNYTICDETRPNLKHVAHVYLFAICYVACLVCALFWLYVHAPGLFRGYGIIVGLPVVAVFVASPWAVLWYVRERAKRWKPGFK